MTNINKKVDKIIKDFGIKNTGIPGKNHNICCQGCYRLGIAEGKKQAKVWCTECNGEDEASVCKWCYQDAINTGRQKEKDIKADHLAGHYIAGKKDAIKIINDWLKSYPINIFPEINSYAMDNIKNLIENNFTFSLDRLSAHIIRDILIKLKGEIENGRSNK